MTSEPFFFSKKGKRTIRKKEKKKKKKKIFGKRKKYSFLFCCSLSRSTKLHTLHPTPYTQRRAKGLLEEEEEAFPFSCFVFAISENVIHRAASHHKSLDIV
jgi:hypothetical protein